MPRSLSRRDFLASGAALASGCAALPGGVAEIIDTHTHFYDPARPEGVPWPDRNDAFLYRTVLPDEYVALARPLGIASTVVVEASPRVADNDWVLELAARQPFLAGLVGHLKPGTPGFASELERLARNPKFKGIRVGGWNIPVQPENSEFLRDVEQVAERGLALDILCGPEQLGSVLKLAQSVPRLRIVIDHCAGARIDGEAPPLPWTSGIERVAGCPNVFMKVSGLPENTGRAGHAPAEPEFYRRILETLWNEFGEDRLIFGSNWPVSARFASLAQILGIVRPYFESKGRRAARKYFRDNARRVYRLA